MPGHDGRDGEARFYCTTFESGLRTPRAKYGRHPDDGGRPKQVTRWIKVSHSANSAPKPNNAWWRCVESGQCNPPAIICRRRRNKVQRPGAMKAALLVDLSELLLKFRDLSPDAPQELLVRGPVHQLAVPHDLHFDFNTLCSARPDHTFGSLADGSAPSGGSVDARDSKSGSARATGLAPARAPRTPLPVGPLIAGLCNAHGRKASIFNSRGRYPLAWRWFGRLPR